MKPKKKLRKDPIVPLHEMDFPRGMGPRDVPLYFFPFGARLDYKTALRADVSKQDHLVQGRLWYIDAESECIDCGSPFVWTAMEQRTWFETYRFWVDSKATRCKRCRFKQRHLKKIRKEYNSIIEAAREQGDQAAKQRVIEIVNELEDALGTIPERMAEARRVFSKQLK